jgi:chemosensory pili system protein ChpC
MAERVTEIYSMLIPLGEGRLLAPRSCVAEVIAYTEPTPMADAPPWYLGLLSWNNRSIPVVSFEGMCGQPIPAGSTRARVVVFHGLLRKLESRAFGLLSQGFPQLVRVSSDVLRADPMRVISDRMPALCGVRLMNETPLVPDLERLELQIAEETSAAA